MKQISEVYSSITPCVYDDLEQRLIHQIYCNIVSKEISVPLTQKSNTNNYLLRPLLSKSVCLCICNYSILI